MKGESIMNREAGWRVLDLPVAGTITSPRSGGSGRAVILVAGSGPTDRNWCSPLLPGENGSGRLLAEALAARGYFTLRYDKLASGPHAMENAAKFAGKISMATHVAELEGAVKTALSESTVPIVDLFALTNSEGAIHAVNYQLQAPRNRFRGLVLTGAPGRAIGTIGRSQLIEQGRGVANFQALLQIYDEAIARFLEGKPVAPDPVLPAGVQLVLRALESPYNLPFARELWTYSLAEHIGSVNEPILVVIGKKDLQIDWKVDGQSLEVATSKKATVTFSFPENANHVLKHEETPREQLNAETVGARYNAPDTALDPQAAESVFRWLEANSNRVS
jgi:uncharacterized protein